MKRPHFSGTKNFEGDLHVLNFEKNQELNLIFDQNLDTKRILSELELFLNKRIRPGRDLIFFDEIQDCPRAISSLRYFYEEVQDLHVIAAGSLPGIMEISQIRSLKAEDNAVIVLYKLK